MTARFDFELVFALPPACDLDAITLSDLVIGAGFDDALIGSGTHGLLAVSLDLTGDAPEDVILTAATTLLQALPSGTRLREVRPDLVSLADVADRLHVKRQALQKRKMPPPAVAGFYRATEVIAALTEAQPKRKPRLTTSDATPWFAAAPAAQRINAYLALGQMDEVSLRRRG